MTPPRPPGPPPRTRAHAPARSHFGSAPSAAMPRPADFAVQVELLQLGTSLVVFLDLCIPTAPERAATHIFREGHQDLPPIARQVARALLLGFCPA